MDTFKETGEWVFIFITGVIALACVVIFWKDIETSYYGWGTIMAELAMHIGFAAWVASAIPTLIQIMFWSAVGIKAPLIENKHRGFIVLSVGMIVADTSADLVALGFFKAIGDGDLRKVIMALFTAVFLYGFLSEFLFLIAVPSFIAALGKMRAPNLGFAGSENSIPDVMSRTMGGASPFRMSPSRRTARPPSRGNGQGWASQMGQDRPSTRSKPVTSRAEAEARHQSIPGMG
jgi:hypothetical protein